MGLAPGWVSRVAEGTHMRTFTLGVALLILMGTPALAVVAGFPDTAHVSSINAGTVNYWNGSAWAAATGGPSGTSLPGARRVDGTVAGIQLGGHNHSVTIEYGFNSKQVGYTGGAGFPHLVIYFGDSGTGVNAIDSGLVQIVNVRYSTDGGSSFGGNVVINRFLPSSGVAGAQAAAAYYITVGQPPLSAIDAMRITYTAVGGAAQFWLAAVQNPEPGTLALFGLGVMGLGTVVIRRRRLRKKL